MSKLSRNFTNNNQKNNFRKKLYSKIGDNSYKSKQNKLNNMKDYIFKKLNNGLMLYPKISKIQTNPNFQLARTIKVLILIKKTKRKRKKYKKRLSGLKKYKKRLDLYH